MSRNSMLVFQMSIVISKSIEGICLIKDFQIFSKEFQEDCFIIARPSSLYKPMFNEPVIGDILLSMYNPIKSLTSAPLNEPIAISKLLMLDFLSRFCCHMILLFGKYALGCLFPVC